MSAFDDLVKMLKKEKKSGSDYTGTVTRVEGNTAYVQLTGSDIADTPVAMTITAKPGDKVRVRVSNGKAYITGNDTLPPSNDQKEVSKRMKADMSNRKKKINIASGIISFLGNTLVVDSDNFKLDENGNATFSGDLKAARGTFSGDLEGASGTFEGTLKGATYVDSSSNFSMDIGTHSQSGSISPAFKIGGYINGNPNNDYLEIEMTLYKVSGADLPQLYIAATVKDSPTAANESSVSLGVGNTGIDFYGSWLESGSLTRVHSSLPWGYNP